MSVDTRIFDAYLECALWAEELDSYTIFDFSKAARDKARSELEQFVDQAGSLLDGLKPEMIGHDFWLTRNGSGVGFWDRGLGDIGDRLTDIAKAFPMLSV